MQQQNSLIEPKLWAQVFVIVKSRRFSQRKRVWHQQQATRMLHFTNRWGLDTQNFTRC
jgi:hypothetical protein